MGKKLLVFLRCECCCLVEYVVESSSVLLSLPRVLYDLVGTAATACKEATNVFIFLLSRESN